MKYYFFKTLYDRGRNRLRPLSGQTFEDGTMIDSSLNVQSDKEIRLAYPLGTIFVSDSLIQIGGFYQSGRLYAITESLRKEEDRPTMDMLNAYTDFCKKTPDSTEEIIEDVTEKVDEKPTFKKSFLEKMKSNRALKVPPIRQGFYVDAKNWYVLLRNIQNQINTMLIGPTGTGKTELILLACDKLGIDCSVYDMGSMYDPVAGLLGVHRLNESGSSVFDYAKFTQDIQKPGVILLDELSRAPVTSLNILFPCLDSRRMLPVEIAGGNDIRNIKIHPDCTFIATANVGAEYTGTMSMDRALVNRFFPMELDYIPEKMEVKVLEGRCGISNDDATLIVYVANQIRKLFKNGEISCAVSIRETLMVSELVADGWELLESMQLVFLPLYEGTTLDGERSTIYKLLMSK